MVARVSRRIKIDFKAWPEVKYMAARLKEARENAKLTQLQASMILGTGQTYVASLENGYTNPTFQLLAQCARAYKVPMSFFVPDKTVRRRPDAPRDRKQVSDAQPEE